MKSEEHLFKLAKTALVGIILSLVLLIFSWMVLQHHPTELVASMNLKEYVIEFSCEFASETPEK